MQIIGIAGGSGAGKSSVSYALLDQYPNRFDIINIDDYHRHRDEPDLPMLHGMINWDHPDIMQWDKLIADVTALKSGETIVIETKDRRINPSYATHRQTVKRTIHPPEILIVEGYLSLYNPELFKLFDKSFYLDVSHEVRILRRDKGRLVGDNEYNEKVLAPMHEKYVEPTKANANEVIDVTNMTIEEIRDTVYRQCL